MFLFNSLHWLIFLNPAQQPMDKHKQVNESHDNLTEIQAHTKSTHRSTLEMQQCWQKKLAKEASKRNISRETIWTPVRGLSELWVVSCVVQTHMRCQLLWTTAFWLRSYIVMNTILAVITLAPYLQKIWVNSGVDNNNPVAFKHSPPGNHEQPDLRIDS